MSDETITINGTRLLAERACRMVFAEDRALGPQCAIPAPLLPVLEAWPGKTDEAVDLALHLPVDFDIAHDMAKNHVKAVVLRACRATVLHLGKKVGYALVTNQAGLNAIALWRELWTAHHRRLRNSL